MHYRLTLSLKTKTQEGIMSYNKTRQLLKDIGFDYRVWRIVPNDLKDQVAKTFLLEMPISEIFEYVDPEWLTATYLNTFDNKKEEMDKSLRQSFTYNFSALFYECMPSDAERRERAIEERGEIEYENKWLAQHAA